MPNEAHMEDWSSVWLVNVLEKTRRKCKKGFPLGPWMTFRYFEMTATATHPHKLTTALSVTLISSASLQYQRFSVWKAETKSIIFRIISLSLQDASHLRIN